MRIFFLTTAVWWKIAIIIKNNFLFMNSVKMCILFVLLAVGKHLYYFYLLQIPFIFWSLSLNWWMQCKAHCIVHCIILSGVCVVPWAFWSVFTVRYIATLRHRVKTWLAVFSDKWSEAHWMPGHFGPGVDIYLGRISILGQQCLPPWWRGGYIYNKVVDIHLPW